MTPRILHILDGTTTGDSLDALAILLGHFPESRIIVMGHRSTADAAEVAGIARDRVGFVPSMGWADPTGWRHIKRILAEFTPEAVHAWGMSGVVAATIAGFRGKKIATGDPSGCLW